MTNERFDLLLEERIDKIRKVLQVKRDEYATMSDRLHNFKRSAAVTGETPEAACVGFFVKHLTSLLDLVDGIAAGKVPKPSTVDEKLGDAVNYLILLEGLLIERLEVKP